MCDNVTYIYFHDSEYWKWRRELLFFNIISHSLSYVCFLPHYTLHLLSKTKISLQPSHLCLYLFCFVLKTFNVILDNNQLDTQLLYFTIRLLQSSTCFENYMLIIRRVNCINAASGIVTLSKWPSGALDGHLTESDDTRCCINKIHPPDDEHDVARNM